MTYKIYIKLYKSRWIGKVLAGDCVQYMYKILNICYKTAKIFEIRFTCV